MIEDKKDFVSWLKEQEKQEKFDKILSKVKIIAAVFYIAVACVIMYYWGIGSGN